MYLSRKYNIDAGLRPYMTISNCMNALCAIKKTGLISGLLLALFAGPVLGDEMDVITKLLRSGQLAEALDRANTSLSERPGDPQIRFLKGLILTEQSKTPEAIAVFTKLTEDHPDLPEPFNNLAVLFASSGQYDKARAALDMAIRTNPTYATAHENLGDVYAKLASQAYDKALQIDSGSNSARSKLTLVRTLTGNTTVATADQAKQQPASKSSVPAPASAVSPIAPAPAKDRIGKAASAVAAAPAASQTGASDRDAVIGAVTGWAKAWSSRDVEAYLNYYANDFQTPGKQSRKAWEAERRSRIEGKERISIEVETPQVSLNGNTATVRFQQAYRSDRLNSTSSKTLSMAKLDGRWLIVRERSED